MKYKILDNTQKQITYTNSKGKQVQCIVKQIQAEDSFGRVKNGDLGGWVENAENLSQQGNCWIYPDGIACGPARVTGNTILGRLGPVEYLEDYNELPPVERFNLDPETSVLNPSARRLSHDPLTFPR